jgi:hypothetical protein
MNDTPMPPIFPEYRDRTTGLRVFGVLEILLACLFAIVVPLTILVQVMTAQAIREEPQLRMIIPNVLFYGVLAVLFLVLGIGSLRASRWARALSLVVSWSWLAMGVFSLTVLFFLLPRLLGTPQTQGQILPEPVQLVIMAIVLSILSIFLILVPGILILFYQNRHVKLTCEARHPQPAWTDACPLPVLGLSLWLGAGALMLLFLPLVSNGVLPAFGVMLSGAGGAFVCLALAAAWAWSARAVYRLNPVGWWMALAILCLGTVSSLITFSRIDLLEMYRLMGYTNRQIMTMKRFSFIQGQGMAYLSLAGALPLATYLFSVRKYFTK